MNSLRPGTERAGIFLSHLCGGECGATALSATAYFLSHLCGGEYILGKPC
ncbi:hypothetical protein BAZOLSSOX_1415 [uncultured Gammaproteobacteria bacterium]|nr:hypothetical protein BAZOLSSOX_1415 [uncultured Gammaproteobacteria bacterium]